MKASEVLAAARELLSDESKWTKGYYGKDVNGNIREAHDKEAVCFCSVGALAVATKMQTGIHGTLAYEEGSREEMNFLAQAMGDGYPLAQQTITTFNDAITTTHAQILEKFDAAIVLAQAADK